MSRLPFAALLLPALLVPAAATAQAFPAKPLRIISPYAPGGTVDILARIVAQKMSEAWGQQVIVDHRPGASGMIGADLVAKSAPDGYTLLMGYTSEIAIVGNLFSKVPYDPIRDFQPVSLAAIAPMMLVVHPSVPVKSVKDIIALAKSKPKELAYASSGTGGPNHLAMALLQTDAGVQLTHVPYKGAAPALIDVLGGHVAMFFSGIVVAMPHVTSGRLRGVAVSTAKRSSAAPEIPTVAESGMRGFDVPTWYGVLVAANTPKDVVAKLNTGVVNAMNAPDVKERLTKEGAEPSPNSPEQFAKFIQTETAKFAQIIKVSGARVD